MYHDYLFIYLLMPTILKDSDGGFLVEERERYIVLMTGQVSDYWYTSMTNMSTVVNEAHVEWILRVTNQHTYTMHHLQQRYGDYKDKLANESKKIHL